MQWILNQYLSSICPAPQKNDINHQYFKLAGDLCNNITLSFLKTTDTCTAQKISQQCLIFHPIVERTKDKSEHYPC